MSRIQIVKPSGEYFDSWQQNLAEWQQENQDGASVFFASMHGWDLATRAGFESWTGFLNEIEQPGASVPQGFVRQATRWAVAGGRYLGAVGLRYELNDFLSELGGHVGYSVRPAERRKGLAGILLAEALRLARSVAMEALLVTCDEDNEGSYRTIEGAGGVLERVVPASELAEKYAVDKALRRYWITL